MEHNDLLQDVIRCCHCGDPDRQLHCDYCDVNLCRDCVDKHISNEASKHRFVLFTKRKTTFIHPECSIKHKCIFFFQIFISPSVWNQKLFLFIKFFFFLWASYCYHNIRYIWKRITVVIKGTGHLSRLTRWRRCMDWKITWKKGIPQILHLWKKTLPAAAYEFSVRKQSDPKRSVTYCKLSSGFTSARSWEARLLCHSDVRAQVNRVVGLGYSVFVRRCLLNDSNRDTVKKSLPRYDYAWNRVKDTTSLRRDATAV